MTSQSRSAAEIARYLDRFLETADIPDSANAWNGLQVDRDGEVDRIAFAVDAAQATIDAAIEGGADLLVVHHGLFWDGKMPITERRYGRMRSLLRGNLGLYSSHLPLDAHPEVGNNTVLARELGVQVEGAFGEYRGVAIGVFGSLDIRREALAARLDHVLGGRVKMIPGGPERVRRVGVVTGAGGSYTLAAREAGLDALVTGEGAHHNYFDAMEGGVNVYFGGHYATEVWGVRALAGHVMRELGLQTFFLDNPTGL